MRVIANRTRDALMLMSLALPAFAQNDGPSVERQSAPVADKKAPQKAYQILRDALAERQKAGIAGIEKFFGQPQFIVGRYPIKYEIKERKALADDAFDAAREISQKDHVNAKWWINFPKQDVAARLKPKVDLLQLPKKEIFGVINDPFVRALDLGLLTLDGSSATPIDAPFTGGSPFDMMAMKQFRCISGDLPATKRPLLPEGIVFKDNSTRSRPEITSGELQGRNLLAGSTGQEDTAGLIDLKGEVEKTTHTTKKVPSRGKEFLVENTKLINDIMAKSVRISKYEQALKLGQLSSRPQGSVELRNRLAQAKNELAALKTAFRELQVKYPPGEKDETTSQTEAEKVNGRAFVGPVGSNVPQNSEELLEISQRLIEAEYREQCAKALVETVGDGKVLFGSDPDRALSLLGQERQKVGGSTKSPSLQSVAEVKQYLTDLAFGLTDDAAADLRRLANDMLSRSKGEHERTQWRDVLIELDRVLPEVEVLRKTESNFPEARRINWSRFKCCLPLETVAPGMLFERLRID